jgi:hypothetical protein
VAVSELAAIGLPPEGPVKSGLRVNRKQSQALPVQVRRGVLALAMVAACMVPCIPTLVLAASGVTIAPEIAARLTPQQLAAYRTYLIARADFERQAQVYWTLVDERREHRRKKHAQQKAFTADDYVLEQPLKYAGPALAPEIAALVATAKPVEPEKPMAALADFLSNARSQFNFVPERTTEHEFKRRYAADALAAGLSKDQVVRVYALETGGRGTFDMQAGIDPDTRNGRPISSAIGYAQLLSANSSNELVRHGEHFIARLEAMQTPVARAKASVLRAMLREAKAVPNEWREHQKFALTPAGQGIHAINLDADIGPWLQVLKLKGLLETAAKEAGRSSLTGAELELMNLAGPRTGLEMMQAIGRRVPTSNFFAEAAYYRNSVVREKTGAELLVALDERMVAGMKKPGAIDFALAFDEIAAGLPGQQTRAARPVQEPAFGTALFADR